MLDTLIDQPYFNTLKNHISQKQLASLIQCFQTHGKLKTIPKSTVLLKYRSKLVDFMILTQGHCLLLHPKPAEQIIKEQSALNSKYPELHKLSQQFKLQFQNQSHQLRYIGEGEYPQEHLNVLSKEIEHLHVASHYQSLQSCLFEGHICRFKESQILRPQNAIVEDGIKKVPYTVLTVDDCELLTVNCSIYEDVMESVRRQKRERVEQLVFKAFDEGIRSVDIRRILQELINQTTIIKVTSHQLLYSMQTQSQYIYLILKGDFLLSYQQQDTTIDENTDSQYQRFKKMIRSEKALPYTSRNDSNHESPPKLKKSKEYTLLKLSQGQMTGDEDFTHDFVNQVYHKYKCQCISAKGKLVAIRKADLYKLCTTHDWFAKMIHKRSEFKRHWLQQRYQVQQHQDEQTSSVQQKSAKTERMEDNNQPTSNNTTLNHSNSNHLKQYRTIQITRQNTNKHIENTNNNPNFIKQFTDTMMKISCKESPPKVTDMNSRNSYRKQMLKKLTDSNRKESPNNPNCIGMMDYLVKLDRHKQMLLQHSINKAIPPALQNHRNPSMATEADLPKPISKLSPQRTYSFKIQRSNSFALKTIFNQK